MKILAVDTALGACSAALLARDAVLARRHEAMARGHAEALAPMVAAVMREAATDFSALDRLAVTIGPGTFTGQRIGLAFMRALKVALEKPLIGITSLQAMAAQAMAETGASCAAAVHDARRGEVYLEICGTTRRPPAIESFAAAADILAPLAAGLVLAGTAAPDMAAQLQQARLTTIIAPDAVWVAKLAAQAPIPPQSPRPLYLRPPDAKLPGAIPAGWP
jgi:tRNA threonylcarbamoyladenosine biosynthesis protein TsaB